MNIINCFALPFLLLRHSLLLEKGGLIMPITKPFIASRRFVSTIGAGTGTGATFAIAATSFTNDAGAAATAFPVQTYYNLYINSMIQTGDTSTLTTTAITIPGGDALDPATPVIVEIIVT